MKDDPQVIYDTIIKYIDKRKYDKIEKSIKNSCDDPGIIKFLYMRLSIHLYILYYNKFPFENIKTSVELSLYHIYEELDEELKFYPDDDFIRLMIKNGSLKLAELAFNLNNPSPKNIKDYIEYLIITRGKNREYHSFIKFIADFIIKNYDYKSVLSMLYVIDDENFTKSIKTHEFYNFIEKEMILDSINLTKKSESKRKM